MQQQLHGKKQTNKKTKSKPEGNIQRKMYIKRITHGVPSLSLMSFDICFILVNTQYSKHPLERMWATGVGGVFQKAGGVYYKGWQRDKTGLFKSEAVF